MAVTFSERKPPEEVRGILSASRTPFNLLLTTTADEALNAPLDLFLRGVLLIQPNFSFVEILQRCESRYSK